MIYLVTAVKAALSKCELKKSTIGIHAWLEDVNTRVEAIRPAGIWCGAQFLAFKQIINVLEDL